MLLYYGATTQGTGRIRSSTLTHWGLGDVAYEKSVQRLLKKQREIRLG